MFSLVIEIPLYSFSRNNCGGKESTGAPFLPKSVLFNSDADLFRPRDTAVFPSEKGLCPLSV